MKTDLHGIIEKLVKESKDSGLKVVLNPKNESIAVWGKKIQKNELVIPLLRVVDNNLSMTLFSQLITDIIEYTIQHKLPKVIITEQFISENWINILQAKGFTKIENNWEKIVLKDFISSSQLFNKYPFVKEHLEADILKVISSQDNTEIKQSLLSEIKKVLSIKND